MNLAQEQTISGGTPWAAIAGVIATVSVFAIAQGLSYPLLSFILQRQGVSPGMIGLSAAMTPIGFIVSSPLIPGVSRWFGAGRTALAGSEAETPFYLRELHPCRRTACRARDAIRAPRPRGR